MSNDVHGVSLERNMQKLDEGRSNLANARGFSSSSTIKSLVAGILCMILSINISADDSVFYLSDEELAVLARETGNYCLIWLGHGRDAHELDRRKKHPNFPEGYWYNLSKESLGMTGNSKIATTSLGYILGEMMLEMAFSGIDPEVTGRTIYNECMKYEPEFSDIGNSDPNPRLRSPSREEGY